MINSSIVLGLKKTNKHEMLEIAYGYILINDDALVLLPKTN